MYNPDGSKDPKLPDDPPSLIRLHPMDVRLLEALAMGASTAEMALELSLSVSGVEGRVTALLRALGVCNRPALVARAHSIGLFAVGGWPPRIHPDYIANP